MISLEELASSSGFIKPEHLAAFLDKINTPGRYASVLRSPHSSELRLQADLLADFPVAAIGPDASPRSSRLAVLVLNNTCDLQPQRSQFVNVVPVFDYEAYAASLLKQRTAAQVQSHLFDVQSNRVNEILWLPPFGVFRQGAVALLNYVSTAAFSLYESAIEENGRRLASFSQFGFYFFLIKLTKFFARPESADVSDRDA